MKQITLSLFLVFTIIRTYSQNYAYIRLVEGDMAQVKEFSFTINGQKILKGDTTTHVVPISQYSMDSIVFYWDNNLGKVALAKFRPLQKYVLKMNPCSMYELYPTQNAKLGVIRFEKLQTPDSFIGMLDSDMDTISMKRGTAFLVPTQSAMCEFSRKLILLAAANYAEAGEDAVISTVRYHFLHGEKLIVRVMPGNKSFDIKIEGYLRKEHTILDYERK